MLVGDNETTSSDPPLRHADIAPPFAVSLEKRRLDLLPSEAELLSLVERVERPAD